MYYLFIIHIILNITPRAYMYGVIIRYKYIKVDWAGVWNINYALKSNTLWT